jgi:hypothetical protein
MIFIFGTHIVTLAVSMLVAAATAVVCTSRVANCVEGAIANYTLWDRL